MLSLWLAPPGVLHRPLTWEKGEAARLLGMGLPGCLTPPDFAAPLSGCLHMAAEMLP
jgi:hypothetical protein